MITKLKIFTLSVILLTSSFSIAATFRCFAPRNNPDAFLAGGFALLSVESNSLRFQQFDGYTGRPTLLRDYVYEFKGIVKRQSKVTGMGEFKLVKEIKSYGDNINTLYVDKVLADGKEGKLIFTGSGFSWDWNYCKRQ